MALDWLVVQGYLKQFSRLYTYRIYSLERERLDDVVRFLREVGEPGI